MEQEYSPKEGTFIIKLESGELKNDTETFGQMDPYVEFTFQGETRKSLIVNDGGKNPVWHNQLFSFRANIGEKIGVKVKDDDPGQDDLVMELDIEVQATEGKEKRQVYGYLDGQTEGNLRIEIQYIRNGQEVDDEANVFLKKEQQKLEDERKEMHQQQHMKEQNIIDDNEELQNIVRQVHSLRKQKKHIIESNQELKKQSDEIKNQLHDVQLGYDAAKDSLEYEKQRADAIASTISKIKNELYSGTLMMECFEIRLQEDHSGYFDKADPYIEIICGEQRAQLKAKSNAGRYCKWDEEVNIKVENQDLVQFQVYDKEMMGKDTYLGAGCFSLFHISGDNKEGHKINLYEKGKVNGTLAIDIKFKQQY